MTGAPDAGAMRRNRETWKALVAEYRASGVSAAEFARRRGLNVGTLRWWCTELREAAQAVEFLAVHAPSRAPVARALLEAVVGAVVVRFEAGTDVEYVAMLLERLRSSC